MISHTVDARPIDQCQSAGANATSTTAAIQPPAYIIPAATTPHTAQFDRRDSTSPCYQKPKVHRHRKKRSSITSISTNGSARSHQEYLDSLQVPTPEMVESIAQIQEQKEVERIKGRLGAEHGHLIDAEREQAAAIIQRSYRGHRERRILVGLSIDPSTRWTEAIKEARYRNLTTPRKKEFRDINGGGDGAVRQSVDTVRTTGSLDPHTNARNNWKKIGFIARRAGGDEDSDSESDEDINEIPAEERDRVHKQKIEARDARRKAAKIMDMQYFLEMVDLKHRYGTNLRTYHEEWKKSDTQENFFYWLDYGEGRYIDCQGCPRATLDSEQVRYLSKEERLDYLVKIDKDGKLCWAKNGAHIDTTTKFKDSIHGIVPADDPTPAFTPADAEAAPELEHHDHHSSDDSDFESDGEDSTEARADKYADPKFDGAKGMKKVKHVSAATIFNKLLRGSVKKNTWIFVADTSFRLYVGIKQSGAFQHSSFLHGSRISAAGLIKIKDGKLEKLSPLSGHYRPPAANFRAFVHSLKEAGCDMTHVHISRSYAVLVGLEAYVKTRKRTKSMLHSLGHRKDRLIHPEKAAKREEEARDTRNSVEHEREILVKQKAAAREDSRLDLKVLKRLSILPSSRPSSHVENRAEAEEEQQLKKDYEVQVPGTGPEQAIALEETRNA